MNPSWGRAAIKPAATCLLLLSLAACQPSEPGTSSSPSEPTATEPGDTSSELSTSQPAPATPSPSPSAAVSATEPTETADADGWSHLQQSETRSFVLMRHALAPGTGDPANFELGDCSTQRNLSETGRNQAQRTGEAFRQRNIAVDQVLSSQWCRCLDTAELMELGEVEPFPPLNSFFQNRALEPEQTEQVRQYMQAQSETAGVTVMVTHFVNIAALSDRQVSSGEMIVMQVNEADQLEVVAQIDAL